MLQPNLRVLDSAAKFCTGFENQVFVKESSKPGDHCEPRFLSLVNKYRTFQPCLAFYFFDICSLILCSKLNLLNCIDANNCNVCYLESFSTRGRECAIPMSPRLALQFLQLAYDVTIVTLVMIWTDAKVTTTCK